MNRSVNEKQRINFIIERIYRKDIIEMLKNVN